ncbi:uncharacterized protein LOC131640561 [Vicia villosa]|uniref:uncharacterized protein LOC131640561 n=1 Tax=Vicia villosa TaxID=3911 RepID=UPI00273B1AC3|nr:uncharacterized protein LOC131640561 [Vicia villosa]
MMNFFQIKSDDDAFDFSAYSTATQTDGDMYVEHIVSGLELSGRTPRCVNDFVGLDATDEDAVERLNNSEDERTTTIADGFEEIDVTIPIREGPEIAGLLPYPSKRKLEDEDYVSEELDSSDPDKYEDEKGPKFEKFRKEQFNKNSKFKWGMQFNSLDDFREAIREWIVLNGREITFVKNEGYRVRVECKAKCGYSMLCSRVDQKETFAIKTINDTHTYARVLENRSTNSRLVAKYVVKKMQTTDTVRISDIIQDMRQNYSAGIIVVWAWKSKFIANNIIEGDADNQYAILWRYASELQRVNGGNTVKINVDRPIPTIQPRFGSFYLCFDGCKKGFINGCRLFVGVDGCHLKTKYGGQLLIDVGRDPIDQYFPSAFGVVETETKESWRWFLQLLMKYVGLDKRFVFISNQQKGLVAVFEDMFERIEHKLCLRHLYANFKKKFGGGALIRDIMIGVAKSTYQQGWLQKMNELKGVDPKAWAWLLAVPPKCWCKHAFSFYPKYDVLMNNIAESFNATILVARDKPILTMYEWIRKYLMNRRSSSALKLEKWPHKVMPIPRKRLDTQELVGIPCRHVVAALSFRQQNPEEFVDECYYREKYKLCYGFAVSPINGQEMWLEVESEELLPPIYKKGPGRPRKLRIMEAGEEGDRRRLPGVSYRCTKCDKIRHNVKSCKSKKQHPNALKIKKKVRYGDATTNVTEAGTLRTDATTNAANHMDASGVGDATTNAATHIDVDADLFGDVTDEMLSSTPDIIQPVQDEEGQGKGKRRKQTKEKEAK